MTADNQHPDAATSQQDDGPELDLPEGVARRIVEAALTESRCAELLVCLMDGGSATVDHGTGRLVTVSGDLLGQMWSKP